MQFLDLILKPRFLSQKLKVRIMSKATNSEAGFFSQ